MKKLYLPFALLLAFSMLLTACGGAQAPAAAPVVEAPMEAPVVETEAPVVIDFATLFDTLVNELPADKGYGTVKPAALSEELADKPPFLLDVREAAELEKDGFIEGAVNIPVRSLLQNLDKLPGLDEPIVVYCASGHRGGMATAALKLMGYTNVRNLAGGAGAWKKAELPLATGSLPAEAQSINTPIIADQALYEALDSFLNGLPDNFYATKTDALAEALTSATPPTIVDIRTAAEFEKDGYIEGAINVPMQEIFHSLDKLPAKDAPIVVHCVSGHRGSIAVMGLQLLGYSNVVNLAGGLNAWKAASMPVVGWVDWPVVWGEFLPTLPADQGYYTVKADVLNGMLVENPPFLVDLREPSEIESSGYISGAINLPVRELLKNLDKLPAQDQKIVVYCGSGHRGALATAALRLLGYADVTNLAGGTGAWTKAEFALESGLPVAPTAVAAPAVDATRLAALDAYLSALPEGFAAVKAADVNVELTGATAPIVVDVRTEAEYAEGHIEGAVNAPLNDLVASLDKLPTDKAAPVVVHCKSGHRAAIAMMYLNFMGYTDVRNLGGGMNSWIGAELPVVK
jgi:rhodanese-related sulfurtransferase